MRRFAPSLMFGVAVVACSLAAGEAPAQGLLDSVAEAPGDEYTSRVGALTPREIIQQKAQVRAAARIARIESQKWYGHSPSRPRTSATPFTGLYGDQYRGRVLGRPSAFYPTRQVVVVR